MKNSKRLNRFAVVCLALAASAALGVTLSFYLGSREVVSAQGAACGCMDVVLVVDDTGSMGSAIDNVKLGLADIITAAKAASGGDLRMGVVSFNDTVEVDQPLTTNIDTDVTTAIGALFAGGGGGEPEASDKALEYVINNAAVSCGVAEPKGPLGAFRPECLKITVLITDATPAGCDDAYVDGVDDVNANTVAGLADAAGVRISAVLVDNGSIITAAHPAGVEPDVMNNYAVATDGVFTTVPTTGEGTGAAIKGIVETCGTANIPGKMTGGGLLFPLDDGFCATHGFTLHGNSASGPNSLEVTWSGGNKFHLETTTTSTCSDNPLISPNPPAAGFDTCQGTGTGRLNGVSGATVEWSFSDAGEPGKDDFGSIVIKDSGGNTVLSIKPGRLKKGNYQAHKN